MPAINKIAALFALAISASALSSPHAARSFNEHHALAARKAAPEPVNEVRVVKPKRLRRRGNSDRCANTASSSTSTSSSSQSTAQIATNVANVVASPSDTPTPTPTPEAAATTWSSEVVASTQISVGGGGSNIFGNFLSGTNTGDATFYATGLGACGITNSDADYIAAIGHGAFDSVPGYDGVNPNTNPICGKSVTASVNGKSVTVQITDRCGGCDNPVSLDFSPAAFHQLGDENAGRLTGMTWVWA